MRVTTQDGKEVDIIEVTMQGNEIRGTLIKPKFQEIFLGKYESSKRTCEVLAEVSCTGWNNKKASYVMPQN